MNDTAQEVGTSLGTAVVGTLIAVFVTTVLPAGTWSSELTASFFHGEQIVFIVLAVAVGLISGFRRVDADERTDGRRAPDARLFRRGSTGAGEALREGLSRSCGGAARSRRRSR